MRNPSPCRARTFLASAATIALGGAVLCGAPAGAATSPSPDPADGTPGVTSLPVSVYDAASDNTRLVIVRRTRSGTELVQRTAPTGADDVVVRRLPAHSGRVAIGTDQAGVETAVVATGGDDTVSVYASGASSAHGALYAVPLEGPRRGTLKRLPVSRGSAPTMNPALRRGVPAFVRRDANA